MWGYSLLNSIEVKFLNMKYSGEIRSGYLLHPDALPGLSVHPYKALVATSSGQRHVQSVDNENSDHITENALKVWNFSCWKWNTSWWKLHVIVSIFREWFTIEWTERRSWEGWEEKNCWQMWSSSRETMKYKRTKSSFRYTPFTSGIRFS